MMRMRAIRDNTVFMIEDILERLQRTSTPEETIALLHHLGRSHYLAALSKLLVDADVGGSRQHFLQAGESRVRLLDLASQHGIGRSRLCAASQADSLFCAIVARAPSLVLRIVDLSPAAPVEEEEYEDDFWYAHALHTFVRGDAASLPAVIQQLERSSEGAEAARVDVLRGLAEPDYKRFEAGLNKMIEERAASFDRKRGRILSDLMGYETERRIFIEGAALLVLAEDAGLPARWERPFIPDLLRL